MSVATAYYRKADGVILVFDVTNEKSFVNIQSRWLDAIMSEDWLVNCRVVCIVYYTRHFCDKFSRYCSNNQTVLATGCCFFNDSAHTLIRKHAYI